MVQLTTHEKLIVIAIKRDIIFVHQQDGSVLHKLTLPPVDPTKLAGAGHNGGDNAEDDDENAPNETNAAEHDGAPAPIEEPIIIDDYAERFKIQHITISASGTLLAITTAEDKAIYIYRITTATDISCELLSKRESTRTSSSICFSPDSEWLLLADKTGDCLLFDCRADNVTVPGQWILAHFSMVLDILMAPNQQHIVTCDRDEKIRVTEYPKTTVIETYCLAHTEFVAAVELLPTQPDSLLLSVSGDKTMKLWNYLSGNELQSVELSGPALRMATRKVSENVSHVAINLHESDSLLVVYAIEGNSNIRLIDEHRMDEVREVTSLMFDTDGNLLLATIIAAKEEEDQTVGLHKFFWKDGKYIADEEISRKWQATVRDNLNVTNIQVNAEEIGLLFKKKFHNIHNYQQRKKRRIEEKNKNKVLC